MPEYNPFEARRKGGGGGAGGGEYNPFQARRGGDDEDKLGWGSLPGTLLHQTEQTFTSLPAIATLFATDQPAFWKGLATGTFDVWKKSLPLGVATAAAIAERPDISRHFLGQYKQNYLEDPLGQTLYVLPLGRAFAGRAGALHLAEEEAARGREVRPGVRSIVGPDAPGRPLTIGELGRAGVLGWKPKGPREEIGARIGTDIPGVGIAGTAIRTRTLPRSYWRAEQAKIVDSLQKMTSPNTPFIGEHRRAARALRRSTRVPYLGLMSLPAYYDFENKWRSMTKPEKVASRMTNLFPQPDDLETYVEQLKLLGDPGADLTIKVLEDPRYRKLYDDPTQKMKEFNGLGHQLDVARQRILIDSGAATPDENGLVPEFVASPYRHTRIIRGAKVLSNSLAYKYIRKTDSDLRRIENLKGNVIDDAAAFGTSDMKKITEMSRKAHKQMVREWDYRGRLLNEFDDPFTHTGTLLDNLSRETDEAHDAVGPLRDKLDAALRGELETDDLGQLGMLPEGPSPVGERAITEAVMKKHRQDEEGELARLEDMQTRAINRELTPNEMRDELELEVIRVDQRKLAEARTERARIEQRLADPRKYNLNQAEITRITRRKRELDRKIAGLDPEEARFAEADARAELARIERQRSQRHQLKLTPKELTSMDRRIDTLRAEILRLSPEEREKEITNLRIDIDRMQQRIANPNKWRLTAENVKDLRRRVSTLERRIVDLGRPQRELIGRYTQAERKLAEMVREQRDRVNELGDLPDIPDALGKKKDAIIRSYTSRYRRALRTYERRLAAEHGVRESLARSAELAAKASGKQARKVVHEWKIKYIQGQRVRMKDLLDQQRDLIALRDEIEQSRGQLVGGGDPQLLRAEFERAGRMVPFYTPDIMMDEQAPKRFQQAQGSIAPYRPRGDIYEGRGILLRRGLLNIGEEALGPAYFRAAKHALNVTMHEQAMQMATTIPREAGLPRGYEFLRRTTGETIGPIERGKGSHMQAVEQEFARSKDMTTTEVDAPDIDWDNGRTRKIVPTSFANEFRAEGRRANNFMYNVFEKPMDIWRTLLLHLRVPWLVNNILGNTFLYTVRFAGVGGLSELVRMYAQDGRTKGLIPVMREFAAKHLSDADMREVFPQQYRGTFLETTASGELPAAVPTRVRDWVDEHENARRVLRGAQSIPTFLPHLDKRYERRLRRLATNRVLRGSDEVRDAYKTLREQGQSPTFREAVDKAIAGDEKFSDYVMTEVNQALGDFLSLSRHERGLIRRLIPFYAWMREITRITSRLVVDHPARVLMLQQLAEVASEIQPDEIPSYMRGAILTEKAGWVGKLLDSPLVDRVSPGLTRALALHGASPYGTVTDVARGLGGLFGGNKYERREFAGNFSPLINAALSAYSRPEGEPSRGLLADYGQELIGSVPQWQLVQPYPSYLYPDRSRTDLLLKILLGDPRVRYDPDEAAYQKEVGR
jgi:hypothetical protein